MAVALEGNPGRREVNGTLWVANRGADTIRGLGRRDRGSRGHREHPDRLAAGRPRVRKGTLPPSACAAPRPQVAVVDTGTLQSDIVTIGGTGTIAGHQWTSRNGHYTFAAFEGPGAGVAVIDHRQSNAVVDTLDYPGRPHGIDLARP